MCGILGLLTLQKNTDAASLYGEEMLQPLRESRGLDAGRFQKVATVLDRSLFFGHARLSIIDLSESANQPMIDERTGFAVTYNGEIYNYRSLRHQLESQYRFKTQSDTEVLLAALQVWGLDTTLKKIEGMFAFVAFDPNSATLMGARDRAGEKPLSYGRVDGDWIWTSDLRVLHNHPRWTREVELERVREYCDFRFVPSPRSIFKNFNKLPPGHCFTMKIDDPSPTVHCYWSIVDEWGNKERSTSEDHWKLSLQKSVEKMVRAADVPVGCFLSGGVDSSLITALASRVYGSELKTYTIQFTDPDYDESAQATAVARALGLESVVLPFGFTEFKESFRHLIGFLDEPVAVHSFFPLGALSKRAKEDVKVCLSGDGGDELFAGYNRHLFWQSYMIRFSQLPQFAKSTAGHFFESGVGSFLTVKTLEFLGIKQADQKTKKIAKALQAVDLNSFYQYLLTNDSNPFGHSPSIPWTQSTPFSGLEAMMALDFSFYMPNDVLNKVDRATMAYGLEARAPFLDIEVLRAAGDLSIDQKINSKGGKLPLKHWLSELIPSVNFHQPKSGFTTPIKKWQSEMLNGDFEDILEASSLLPLLSSSYIEKLGQRTLGGDEIFTLYCLCHWLDKHYLKVVF